MTVHSPKHDSDKEGFLKKVEDAAKHNLGSLKKGALLQRVKSRFDRVVEFGKQKATTVKEYALEKASEARFIFDTLVGKVSKADIQRIDDVMELLEKVEKSRGVPMDVLFAKDKIREIENKGLRDTAERDLNDLLKVISKKLSKVDLNKLVQLIDNIKEQNAKDEGLQKLLKEIDDKLKKK